MKSWIFDVDGVITDLYTKEVRHFEILEMIGDKLSNEIPVGIITGRALSTLERAIIDPLEKILKGDGRLDMLNYQGEFGGLTIEYHNGKKEVKVDFDYALPRKLISKGEEIINKYRSNVFFAPKQTFLTAEMHDKGNIAEFKSAQEEIAQEMKKLVEEFHLQNSVEVQNDQIAVNVKNKKLNKHLATNKFLSWLMHKKLNPDIFYVFGDNESDLQIGEELYENGKKLKFIYTGDKELKKYPFEIVKTKEKFDDGTVEYLSSYPNE